MYYDHCYNKHYDRKYEYYRYKYHRKDEGCRLHKIRRQKIHGRKSVIRMLSAISNIPVIELIKQIITIIISALSGRRSTLRQIRLDKLT